MGKPNTRNAARLNNAELTAVLRLLGGHVLNMPVDLASAYTKLADDYDTRGIGRATDLQAYVLDHGLLSQSTHYVALGTSPELLDEPCQSVLQFR